MDTTSGPGMRELLATDFAWTPRQRQVLSLVAEGKTNQEIADALGISLDGAKWHMREILSKLGVERREQAAEYWREHERWRRRAARLAKGLVLAPVARWLGAGAVSAVAIVAALLLVALLGDGGSPSAVEADLLPSEERAVPPFPAPADLGLLAFIRDGNVWVKPVPDGPEVRLTEDGGYYGPSWSPSGAWLAVWRNLHVVFLGRDGRQFEVPVTNTESWQWSPVRDVLAYIDAGTGELKLFDPESRSATTRWSPGSNDAAGRFAWSPDGSHIALGLAATPPAQPVAKNDVGAPGAGAPLLLVDVAAGSASELTRSRYQTGDFIPVAWTPDGKGIIAYESPAGYASLGRDGLELRHVHAASGQVTDLGVGALIDADRIATGPNVTAIVAGGWRATWTNKRLLAAPMDGGAAVELPNVPPGAVASAAFDPIDGTRLAYAIGPDLPDIGGGEEAHEGLMQRRIYVYDFSSQTTRKLLDDPRYRDDRPLWAVDGTHLLFIRLDRKDEMSLWLVQDDGGGLREVVEGLNLGTDLGWFGYYGNIDWTRVYDWWQPGRPAWMRD